MFACRPAMQGAQSSLPDGDEPLVIFGSWALSTHVHAPLNIFVQNEFMDSQKKNMGYTQQFRTITWTIQLGSSPRRRFLSVVAASELSELRLKSTLHRFSTAIAPITLLEKWRFGINAAELKTLSFLFHTFLRHRSTMHLNHLQFGQGWRCVVLSASVASNSWLQAEMSCMQQSSALFFLKLTQKAAKRVYATLLHGELPETRKQNLMYGGVVVSRHGKGKVNTYK